MPGLVTGATMTPGPPGVRVEIKTLHKLDIVLSLFAARYYRRASVAGARFAFLFVSQHEVEFIISHR